MKIQNSEPETTTMTAEPADERFSERADPTDLLLFDVATRNSLLQKTFRSVEKFFDEVDEANVSPALDPLAVRDFISSFSFDQPLAPETVIDRVEQGLWQYQIHVSHRRYFGLFNPAPSTMGVVADTLVAAFNPQLAAWSHNPFAVEVEQHLIRELGAKFGLGSNCDGTFTSAGAEANQVALLCAMHNAVPELADDGLVGMSKLPVFYLSEAAHHSFEKASRSIGLGSKGVRKVPIDPHMRIDIDALKQMVRADREAGRLPFMLVGTAGTTTAGIVDPLPKLSQIAREEDLWFHVDAAWGGAAVLVPELRDLLKGIEEADSITFDAHKWMSVPMGAGMFMTRRSGALQRCFGIHTPYMPKQGADLDIVDPFTHSPQWSRRFTGLKLFMTLAAAGWKGYEQVLRHQAAMGALLRHRLVEEGWTVLNDTHLPVVCFTSVSDAWTPAEHQKLVDQVVESGRTWISSVELYGKAPGLRACITNFRSEPRDIEALVAELNDARSNMRREGSR